MVVAKSKKEIKHKLYNADLALKGVSALVAALDISMREGDARPTDEMISDALYTIEVMLDQIATEVERHDEEENKRLRAIAEHTGIPMMQLYEM